MVILRNTIKDYVRTKNNFIIQSSKTKQYFIYENFEEFEDFEKYCQEKIFHEIIFGDDIQRFKVDIDIPVGSINIETFNFKSLINDIIFIVLKNKKIPFVVYNSSDKNYKLSAHILFNIFFKNNCEAKKFYDLIIKEIDKDYEKFIDFSVYKSIQAFRLPNHYKDEIPIRQKKYWYGDQTIKYVKYIKELDGDIECECESESNYNCDIVKYNTIAIKDSLILNIIDQVIEKDNGLIFRSFDENKNTILFNRVNSSVCFICDRIHDKENSIYVVINNNSYQIYCRRNNEKKFINVSLEDNQEIKTIYNTIEKNNKQNSLFTLIKNKNKISENLIPIENLFSKGNKIVYSDKDGMRDYTFSDDNIKILFVKGSMKLGKTKQLKEYILANEEKYKHIIIISFRILFSIELCSKLNNFNNYLTIKDKEISIKQYKKIIIQLESLHKLKIDVIPDLIVLDECESILQQFNSPYMRYNLRLIWELFRMFIIQSKRIILMDANLSIRTFNVFKNILNYNNSKFIKSCNLHFNTYSQLQNDKYIFLKSENDFLKILFNEVNEKNKKVIIPINSLSKAKILFTIISKKCVDKKVILYSSETDDYIKRKHLLDVNTTWLNYDIIIYTPCITAGVSFENIHFDINMPYFITTSCDVYTAVQMLHRVRNIKEKKFYIFIKESSNNDNNKTIISTRDEIIKMIRNSFSNFVGDCCVLQYTLEFDEKQQKIINNINEKDSYFTLWLENKFFEYISLNKFLEEFIIFLNYHGCLIEIYNDYDYDKNQCYNFKEEIDNIKEIILLDENQKIVESSLLTPIQYQNLQNKIMLTEVEKIAKKKFWLKKLFNLLNNDNDCNKIKSSLIIENDKEILLKFLMKFNNQKNISLCINLNRIYNFTKDFQKIYSLTMDNIFENDDIIESITILNSKDIHNFKRLLDILEKLGFKMIKNNSEVIISVKQDELITNIENQIQYICNILYNTILPSLFPHFISMENISIEKKISEVFEFSKCIKRIPENNQKILKLLNKIFNKIWGCVIKYNPKDNWNRLEFNNNFIPLSFPVEINYEILN